jgi:hypothetical protein
MADYRRNRIGSKTSGLIPFAVVAAATSGLALTAGLACAPT